MFHVKHVSPHILLINPWITDFAAYNFWIKPLGLLHIVSLLRGYGFRITLIDCLDFKSKKRKFGDGNFLKAKIEKPQPLKAIPRYYSRYGIPEKELLRKLSCIEKPDVIGVTSGMTYWYPGLFKIIEIVRSFFEEVPILLGGIYATLCYDHAVKHSGADIVFKGRDEGEAVRLVAEFTDIELPASNPELRTDTYPAFDLYPELDYICMATSRGCPFTCTYCASQFLNRGFVRRDPLRVVEEIDYWTKEHNVKNIAFYDDALLIEPSEHIIPVLKEVMRKGIRCNFHAPNGLHIKGIDEEVAELLFTGGFRTIRLGFETSEEKIQTETGGKVGNQDFKKAVRNLRRAGYSGEEIGVYIMIGLPGQKVEGAEESIAFVKETGAKPILVEYSPIPKTAMFERAKRMSAFDLENEPLFHNNTILPCQWEGFTMADYRRLKEGLAGRE
jgi:radical SAM superfamily enzyme YgiQ (UPF0313 family)